MSTGIPTPNLAPWLPEDTFWQDNVETIRDIFGTARTQFPETAVPEIDIDQLNEPSENTRKWMWERLMGHQHGSHQGFGGKLPLTIDKEGHFWPDVTRLHYGPYSFVSANPADKNTSYDKAFILGGTPSQNANRLLAALSHSPLEGNVDEVIFMAGQRLRWDIPGEANIDDIYTALARYSGADMDKLRNLSPWIKQQENMQKSSSSEWDRPYATEFELARLAVEAVFRDAIDWSDYQVNTADDEEPVSFSYIEEGQTKYTAPREVTHVTYELKDARKVHVMNGKPVQRKQGVFPKPTSDSTTREAVDLIGIDPGDSLIIGTSVPHARAGLDALIRIVSLKGPDIKKIDIATGPWERGYELLTALGEIPATHKADARLRAALKGENPDTPELLSL